MKYKVNKGLIMHPCIAIKRQPPCQKRHKQRGIVLAINLILLLLITLLATAMFKNGLNQQQMANAFQLSMVNKHRAAQLVVIAKATLTLMIKANQDLTVNQTGYFANELEFEHANFSWLNTQHTIVNDELGKYAIIYKGKFSKQVGQNIALTHHIFTIWVQSQYSKNSDVIEKHFVAIQQ